jgi:Spy/CpxP family protein refolding chaperone
LISPRLRAGATLLAVFALGAATGAAGARYTTSRSLHHFLDASPSEARRRAMLWALDRKLSLSDEQRDRIEAILASHSAEFAAIARRTEPELEPLMARVEVEIRATLTPEQQAKFVELSAKRRERRLRALESGDTDADAGGPR